MFLTLLCSAVHLAAKAFHQDPNGDGSILSFTHSGLLKTSVGFAQFINAKHFSANHVLHVTFIPAESHKTLKPKILEFLQPAAPLEISIHPDVRDGVTVDAALGFANQAARDAAANRIAAAKQAGELSWRPFKGRSKETVKVAYSSLGIKLPTCSTRECKILTSLFGGWGFSRPYFQVAG